MPNVDRDLIQFMIYKKKLWSDPMAIIQIKKLHMILQNNSFAKN